MHEQGFAQPWLAPTMPILSSTMPWLSDEKLMGELVYTLMEEGDSSIYLQGDEQHPHKGSWDDFDCLGVEEDNLMGFNENPLPSTLLAPPTIK